MAVTETRPYELGDYLGDKDPDEVYIPVDHADWPRPKHIPMSGFITDPLKSGSLGNGFHVESGRLTGLTNRYVTQDFDVDFNEIPTGRKNLHVYRVEDLGGGETVDTDVTIYGLDVTPTGFSFYISADESLSGVVVEYLFI